MKSTFFDKAKITVRAGRGGDGAVSFRREKYVAAGGPDGGDGGRGGNVYFVADDNLSSLLDFRYKRRYAAPPGEAGSGRNKSGHGGEDVVIRIPRGTLVKEANSGQLLADMSGSEPVLIAKGGRGGFGNQHFATPTRQVPNFAKPGKLGDAYDIELELMLIADVGLLGFPNVGKSTLLSAISAARPKVANYHFTTLVPSLGVVSVGSEATFVVADIPGIIEGAAGGAGLGHDFLRHTERCRLLWHIVDVASVEGRDPKKDFEILNTELQAFSTSLAARPQLLVANKQDVASDEQCEQIKIFAAEKNIPLYIVSGATTQGIKRLVEDSYKLLQTLEKPKIEIEDYTPPPPPLPRAYTVLKISGDEFSVEAPFVERLLSGSDVNDYSNLQHFAKILQDSGIINELKQQGATQGDTVYIGEWAFDFIE